MFNATSSQEIIFESRFADSLFYKGIAIAKGVLHAVVNTPKVFTVCLFPYPPGSIEFREAQELIGTMELVRSLFSGIGLLFSMGMGYQLLFTKVTFITAGFVIVLSYCCAGITYSMMRVESFRKNTCSYSGPISNTQVCCVKNLQGSGSVRLPN